MAGTIASEETGETGVMMVLISVSATGAFAATSWWGTREGEDVVRPRNTPKLGLLSIACAQSDLDIFKMIGNTHHGYGKARDWFCWCVLALSWM
jgi:hypothetical protein